MGAGNGFMDLTFESASDNRTKQYYAVELGATNDQVDVCNAAADRAIGILQNEPNSNEAARVRLMGISDAYSDGSGTAIARGDYVGTSVTGTIVKKATADYGVLGIALDASSAAGTIIRVLLMPINWFRTAGG